MGGEPQRGPNKYLLYHYGSWGLGLGALKIYLSAPTPIICYWPSQGGTSIVVRFVIGCVVYQL